MNSTTIERVGEATGESLAKGYGDALTGLNELTKAYQSLAIRNADRLSASLRSLSGVKSPAEFVEVQRALIKEGVEAAVVDGKEISHLTSAFFKAALEPLHKQLLAAHGKAEK